MCGAAFCALRTRSFHAKQIPPSALDGPHHSCADGYRRRAGAGPEELRAAITTKVLPNGLTLLICERPDAPVFSYTTFIDAGGVNDPSGESGLAHMFEHLAFKGTSQIGTNDYAAEKVALAKVEAANDAYEAEYLEARRPRPARSSPS